MMDYTMLYPRTTETRRSVSLDGMWKFKLDTNAVGEQENWKDGIPGKDMIPVPASFQDFYTEKDVREFCGDYWYENEFIVPKEWQGKRILLRFDAVTHRGTVYVNGEKITEHEGGFLPFVADITRVVKYDQQNRVVVKGNDELTETNIPCGTTKVLADGKKMNKPYFDFFNYAGLQRSVHLMALPEISIEDFDLTYKIDGSNAEVHYIVKDTNDLHDTADQYAYQIEVKLYDEDDNEVAHAEGKEGVLKVSDAHLWNVRAAYLYRLVITLKANNTVCDVYEQQIGIRTVEIKGKEILINGSPVYLKGFGKHEDSAVVGRGFNIGIMKRDFELMKWIGANSFRTSHYPYSEEIYQQADREGFLVIDEVPAVGLFESLMNFMDATSGKRTAFFEKDTTPILLKAHKKALEEMITRDKNHPCVFAWSLLNEPESTDSAAVPYFKELFDLVRTIDPQKRPRTFTIVGNSTPDKCKCYQFSDFISLNRYYGWYYFGGYELTTAMTMFHKEMDAWKALNLNRPFIFTEYGGDTLGSEHKLPSVMWSQEYQKELLDATNEVFDSYDFVKGEQIWNFADFQTTEGIMRVNGNKKGVFTRDRQPKDAAYLLKERWERLPLDYKRQK